MILSKVRYRKNIWENTTKFQEYFTYVCMIFAF